jgi:hypothetical protein
MLYGIQIRAHGCPRNRSHGFALEVGGYCSSRSEQDIRRLTGGMRRKVEDVIQARGGYTRYWTLNNRCRQVIHKWRFESEMTIWSCFLNCEGQFYKQFYYSFCNFPFLHTIQILQFIYTAIHYTYYTLRKKLCTLMFFWNDKWYEKYQEITDQISSSTQWYLLGHYIGHRE